jgi:hypothetical protein
VIVRIVTTSGFEWADAGIGAGGVALSIVGLGGALTISQRRRPPSSKSTARTGGHP